MLQPSAEVKDLEGFLRQLHLSLLTQMSVMSVESCGTGDASHTNACMRVSLYTVEAR